MSMAVGFDAAFDSGQAGVRQHLSPAAQVEGRLRLVLRELDGQRCHRRKVRFKGNERNLR